MRQTLAEAQNLLGGLAQQKALLSLPQTSNTQMAPTLASSANPDMEVLARRVLVFFHVKPNLNKVKKFHVQVRTLRKNLKVKKDCVSSACISYFEPKWPQQHAVFCCWLHFDATLHYVFMWIWMIHK